MKAYLDYLQYVLDNGVWTKNRTGVDTLACSGYMLVHDMKDGFPLLTTKKMGLKSIAAELEMFIKGITDKRFLRERGCKIWNEWCNPQKVPYATDAETKAKMAAEPDLGPIYGAQWVSFNGVSEKLHYFLRALQMAGGANANFHHYHIVTSQKFLKRSSILPIGILDVPATMPGFRTAP